MDAGGNKSLAIFPAKFRKSMWIKRGSFVIIGERASSTAIESGYKVTCNVSQVLFHEQVRVLQKSPEWPDIFKTTTSGNGHRQKVIPECTEKLNTSDDDDLPAIEANMNRIRPFKPSSDSESESDSNCDPIS
ncbi:hypothetical protein ACHQM5_021269 [Ranunculus cassubicifolius]